MKSLKRGYMTPRCAGNVVQTRGNCGEHCAGVCGHKPGRMCDAGAEVINQTNAYLSAEFCDPGATGMHIQWGTNLGVNNVTIRIPVRELIELDPAWDEFYFINTQVRIDR